MVPVQQPMLAEAMLLLSTLTAPEERVCGGPMCGGPMCGPSVTPNCGAGSRSAAVAGDRAQHRVEVPPAGGTDPLRPAEQGSPPHLPRNLTSRGAEF